uniref:Uncharacterized protein n=1 Tax=Anguilla anguilla TaxID=7936 RepID=A0A0E9XF12_ANGAN
MAADWKPQNPGRHCCRPELEFLIPALMTTVCRQHTQTHARPNSLKL